MAVLSGGAEGHADGGGGGGYLSNERGNLNGAYGGGSYNSGTNQVTPLMPASDKARNINQ